MPMHNRGSSDAPSTSIAEIPPSALHFYIRRTLLFSLALLHTKHPEKSVLTSRADTNCKGLRAALRSGVLVSRSVRALAREVSSSEGCCLDGLLAAILLRAAMIVDKDGRKAACFLVDSREEWLGLSRWSIKSIALEFFWLLRIWCFVGTLA